MARTPRRHSPATAPLGRRERQIVDVVYRLGRATVSAVRAELEDPPSYSAVRGMLNLLEEKGQLRHEADGLRYVYLPVGSAAQARSQAIAHVVRTFFGGSTADAATALFELPDQEWSKADLARLQSLVNDALKEGR
jgi:predicted transcriptional regulator